MTDNNLNLKYGYINNKKSSFTRNDMEWHSIIISLWLRAQIAPRYYSNGLVQIHVLNYI